MVSSIDPKEESWNQLQRQLSNQRKTRESKRGGGGNNNNQNNNTFKRTGKTYANNHNNNNNVTFSNINNTPVESRGNTGGGGGGGGDNRPIRPSKYATYIQSPSSNTNTPNTRNRFQNNNTSTSNNANVNNYTPLNTPPRLRALNNNNESTSATNVLPGISPYTSARNLNEAPNLESWGITNQPRGGTNEDLYSLYRYNPSPLMPVLNTTTLQSYLNKDRKPYMVVPSLRRSYFDSPSTFMLDSSPTMQHYNYIQSKPYSRPVQFSSLATRIERATDEYDYFKTNTAFSNQYIDEFISKTLQDQIIPDILIETIATVKRDEKKGKTSKATFNDPLREEATQLLLKVNKNLDSDNQNDLFSTRFIEELDYKAKIPTKSEPRVRPRRFDPEEELVDIYIRQIKDEVILAPSPEPLIQIQSPVHVETIHYNKITSTELTQQIIEDEGKRFDELRAMELVMREDIIDPVVLKMCKEIAYEVLGGYRKQVDLLQQKEIKKSADEHLLETLTLDHLLSKMASHGRLVAENDDVNKLLDSMMIDILLHTQSDVRKTKGKTLDNYPLKKFHLNSFMNVALDALVGELSASLEDDMRELEIEEKKTLFPVH